MLYVRTFLGIVALLLTSSPPASKAQDTTLRFVIWKSEAPGLWERAMADFEKRNPGVRMIQEIGPHSSTQFHDLVSQKLKNRDSEMDVFVMDVVWPAEFASAGWALPLDRYFPEAEQNKFLAAPLLANRYRGHVYGVPLFVDAGLLYYRKDLLAKYNFAPPRSWPELVDQAKTIVAREKDPLLSGFSGQFKQYEGLVCDMMEYILSNGGALWDEKRLVSALQQPQAVEAVRFVRDKIIGEISNRGVLAYQEPESLALFTQGNAVFHRNWPYAWKIANDPELSKVAGKVAMATLPGFPGHHGVATLGGWQMGVSRFSKKPDLAWRFVDFMTSPEMQKRIALVTGRPPTRAALYDDPELRQKIPKLPSLLENFKQAVPRPTTPVYVPLSNIMQRYFSSALALPDTNIAERAALAARDMDRVLDLLRGAVAP
jgi:trehalose/maltose transport system substrate-binding protein